MIKNFLFLAFILIANLLFAQSNVPQNWFHLDPNKDGYLGVSSDMTYQSILKDKPSQTVVVAIIDSGIDVEHEDLKDNIWVNEDEIPGNGIDDDKNGYVDDIHGWNFIGGADGRNVGSDTYEVTRLYKKLKYRYENADPGVLNKKQAEEYKLFLKYKEEVENKRNSATNNYNKMLENEELLLGAIDAIEKELKGKPINLENVMKVSSMEQSVAIGKNILANFIQEGEELENLESVRTEISEQLKGAINHYKNQIDYSYNPDFDPRNIVGDNYNDVSERYYGNNDVEGPDAFHGTHVAGIIGAVRNNEIGMNGIASNVRLMSVRTVPDGDERDKDVANAIFYAVDNGAQVINMSFGKGYEWEKGIVDKAVRYARKKDVLLVHAAGNGSQDNDSNMNFPNDTYKKKRLFGKKKADNWIAVGALSYKQGEDLVAPFSNYGKEEVDVFAPGMKIYSTIPDNKYQDAQGTSMASPVVAGVAAVLRSYFPGLSAQQVKSIIEQSADKKSIKVRKPGTDEIVNFTELSASGGVINLDKAVKLASTTKGKKKIKKSKSGNKV